MHIVQRSTLPLFLTMPPLKRKRPATPTEESEDDALSAYSEVAADDEDFDISSALTGKRPKLSPQEDEDEDELAQFIQTSISKRSIKEGVQVVKSSKGKAKLTKGEVGGGSFQSMGRSSVYCTGSNLSDI
jgi:ATP-dependent RNA helicase DDX54/DBP10